MHIPYRLNRFDEANDEIKARAFSLLENAPRPLRINKYQARIYPCVVVFCGTEYFGAEIKQPQELSWQVPDDQGLYILSFMRPAELRKHCLDYYSVDPLYAPAPPPPSAYLNFMQRLVYSQIGLPSDCLRQSWTQYLSRKPRTDARDMYLRGHFGTAVMTDLDMQRDLERINGEANYEVQVNTSLLKYQMDNVMSPAAQKAALSAFADECTTHTNLGRCA